MKKPMHPKQSGAMLAFARLSKGLADMDSKTKLERLVDLPSLPTLLMDALQCSAGNPNFNNLADKIGRDPPMVARILRIANSPYYGMSREIGSLREAIILLGLNRVREMLLGICFLNLLPVQHKDFDYPSFWHHSMAVADCAGQLAIHTGISPDMAFTAGLLHDIGLLVVVFLFPNDFSRIINEPPSNRREIERRIMGFYHVEIGSKAARQWNLPVAIQEAIEQHETSPAADAAISLGGLIYTANLLVKEAGQEGGNAGFEHRETIANTLELLDIPFDQATHWADSSRQFADRILAVL